MGDLTNPGKKTEELRREYTQKALSLKTVQNDPVEQFAIWFEEAMDSNLPDVNAMTLSTVGSAGKPSSRIVLLKGFDQQGFRFYTNYRSRKGQELETNPYAALCFFWSELERQVRIEGIVEKLSREKSAEYFKKRPRESQIGAWASEQSSKIPGREELEKNFRELKERFDGKEVPLPDFWGGYLLRPQAIEFWQGRPGRLHDRILYNKTDAGWETSRLSP